MPGQSRLFLEYQNEPSQLRRYYPDAVNSLSELTQRIPLVLENHKADRGILCEALAETNAKFGAGTKTFENIELLRLPDTVAVVTGQQAGLLLVRCTRSIRHCPPSNKPNASASRASVRCRFFGSRPKITILRRFRRLTSFGRCGDLVESKTEPKHCHENLPVGYIKLDDTIISNIEMLAESLLPTEFASEVREILADCWKPGEYFGDAFGKMLTMLTGDLGLIILCPLNQKLKELASPIYVEAIRRSAEIVSALCDRSEYLEKNGYAAQVLVGEDYFPVFRQASDDTEMP